MTLNAGEVHKMKYAQPSTEGVLPIILERWSPRAFEDRDVSRADLKKIFEAARWAPSSFNEQPWRFIIGHRNSETYKKIHDVLVPFNRRGQGMPRYSFSASPERGSAITTRLITMRSTILAQRTVLLPCKPLPWALRRIRWRVLIRPKCAKPLQFQRFTPSDR